MCIHDVSLTCRSRTLSLTPAEERPVLAAVPLRRVERGNRRRPRVPLREPQPPPGPPVRVAQENREAAINTLRATNPQYTVHAVELYHLLYPRKT